MLLIPLIMQSTWIVYLSGFTCNRSSPTEAEPATEVGAKLSERGAKNASETLSDYIAFAFAVRISHQPCIDWTIGKWILSVFLREEVNWLNYWKCIVKLSGNRGKYDTSSSLPLLAPLQSRVTVQKWHIDIQTLHQNCSLSVYMCYIKFKLISEWNEY